MPNHVINIVTFSSRFDEIREYVKSEDHGVFDFNKIIPMPDDVYASTTERRSGTPLWYDWSIENWGTKWNAYEIQEMENGFSFWTAWSTPEQVFRALAQKFPDVEIEVNFADEDLGSGNNGTLVFNGDEASYTEGDYKFACDLWGHEPDDEDEDEDEEENDPIGDAFYPIDEYLSDRDTDLAM